VSVDASGFKELGIAPTFIDTIVPTYIHPVSKKAS
jgi:hypothetical protein